MRQLLFFLAFTLAFHCAKSQDIIVTTEQDTISCRITRITNEFIHFSVFDKRSGILLMQSRLPLTHIAYHNQAKPEDNPSDPDDEVEAIETRPIRDEDRFILEDFEPASFRLSLNTGYTYQLGGYQGLPSSYKKQMQSLWNFGSEFHYFVSENIGLGVKYNHIYTHANEDFQPPYSTAFGFTNLRDERIRFNYLGLSASYRNFFYDDQVVNYFIAGGIVRYRTDGKGDGVPFYQEGDTFGFVLGFSYDFLLVENFGVGLGAEVNIARLSEFDNNGTVVPADFSLTRVDFTIGLRLFK
ncbi:hypothetical protein [Ekhidna sp.]|uniref:hypothetical protein n=1 Tax=Ekhidna sp. TaxID=2608089 RepID=UPI0032EE5039